MRITSELNFYLDDNSTRRLSMQIAPKRFVVPDSSRHLSHNSVHTDLAVCVIGLHSEQQNVLTFSIFCQISCVRTQIVEIRLLM